MGNISQHEYMNATILHVNTCDSGGGAARVASSLHQVCCREVKNSWFAVGVQQDSLPNTICIPHNSYRSQWHRGLLVPLQKTERFFSHIGWTAGERIEEAFKKRLGVEKDILGRENFNYPGTWYLLELTPEKPDILHCHNLHGGYFDLRALPYLSSEVPIILTLHDAWLLSGHCAHSLDCEKWKNGCGNCPYLDVYPEMKFDATGYNWQRKCSIYSKCRFYIATPCQWLMRKVEASILEAAVVHKKVIPNGIDLEVFCPGNKKRVREMLGIPLDSRVLLFVSDSIKGNPHRCYKMLEDVMVQLARKCPSEFLLLICVGGEEERIQILENAEIHTFKYQRDQEAMAHFYQSADIFLFPSKVDTFPLAIIEALSCGVPVIATAVGGIPEQIEEGKTGFLVQPENACQMANRIQQLLNEEQILKAFGKNARETALKHFNFNDQIAAYRSWYQEILSSK